jgi:hypothetical protein
MPGEWSVEEDRASTGTSTRAEQSRGAASERRRRERTRGWRKGREGDGGEWRGGGREGGRVRGSDQAERLSLRSSRDDREDDDNDAAAAGAESTQGGKKAWFMDMSWLAMAISIHARWRRWWRQSDLFQITWVCRRGMTEEFLFPLWEKRNLEVNKKIHIFISNTEVTMNHESKDFVMTHSSDIGRPMMLLKTLNKKKEELQPSCWPA